MSILLNDEALCCGARRLAVQLAAALMDMSYGAGQKLQQRAKAALRQELEKEGLTV